MSGLIVYYSHAGENYICGTVKHLEEGVTETAAKMLWELTGAELFRIQTLCAEPKDLSAFLNRCKCDYRRKARPELLHPPQRLAVCTTVFLGYPNYFNTMPMAVYSFLERTDLSGKTLHLFCTHGGDGFGQSVGEIARLCPKTRLDIGPAILDCKVRDAKKLLREWVDTIHYDKEEHTMKKGLVAYFSASGVTRRLSQRLAAATGADLFEIEPQTPYTTADLDWHDQNSRSSVEMKDRSSRPAIGSVVADMGAYDVVFVGFPVWWYREPSIIDTFMESYDFSGKTVVPFATSGTSDIGDSGSNLQALAAGAKVEAGRRFDAEAPENELAAWAGQWM